MIRDMGIDAGSMRKAGVGIYVIVGLSMVLVIFQIGEGKRWARLMLLVSFIFEGLYVLGQGAAGPEDYLAAIPDLGLQMAALYWLYTPPGRGWFERAKV